MTKYSLRSNEKKAFTVFLAEKNTARTRLASLVLTALLMVALIVSALKYLDSPTWIYITSLSILLAGQGIMEAARRWKNGALSLYGELVVFTAVVQLVFALIWCGLGHEAGLAVFVIGVLITALLRFMSLAIAIPIFSCFIILYGLILWLGHVFDLGVWLCALAFCSFASMWSKWSYESCIIEFRSQCLVEQLKEKNRRLDALALQDSLTGLPNRRYFDRVLEQCWTNPSLSGQSVALIMLDIDHFKEYNDSRGHPAGDLCLQRVAQAFSSVLRADGTAIRIGGEEFAVILERASVDEALVAARRLTEAVRLDGLVTASAGVASCVPAKGTQEALYQAADGALYRAKNSGRDRIERA